MAEQTEAKDFDTIADELLDKAGIDTPTDSSPDTKQEDVSRETKPETAEVSKTEQVQKVEGDRSLSVEDKLTKIKELLGDDEKALDAYIKQKGYHNDPAWQKQREQIDKLKKEGKASGLSDEDKQALDEFKKFRSSPEYIKTSMKADGYTEEAIDKRLQEEGFEVKVKPEDDVALVINRLGIKLDDMAEPDRLSLKSNISDIVKIADIIIQDRLGKNLSKELGPVKENLNAMEAEKTSQKMIESMKATIASEKILDFDKDIEPLLNKFLDDNLDANLQDLHAYFKDLNHNLTVERLKTGKKQDERNDKKSNLRQNIPLSPGKLNAPKKSGNFDKDADAFLDSINL